MRGLELSADKTRIVHITEGFDFLGFNIRQYKVSNTRTGYKLLIKPSKASEKRIREKLRKEWYSLVGQDVQTVLSRLNPIIRGQANYFRTQVSSEVFNRLDGWNFIREGRYIKRTHPNKPRNWTDSKYFGKLRPGSKDKWVFGDKRTGNYLLKYSWFPIERHTLVQGKASPDDPSLREYWEKRNRRNMPELIPSLERLARNQQGICRYCGEPLANGEELQKHHKEPKSEGGKDTFGNLEMVHLYCHQQITARMLGEQSEVRRQLKRRLAITDKASGD
jgi:RNA-directed DNA polymerase